MSYHQKGKKKKPKPKPRSAHVSDVACSVFMVEKCEDKEKKAHSSLAENPHT